MDKFKLYKNAFFPHKNATKIAYKHEVIIGIGGNEGDVMKRFKYLLKYWQNDRRLKVVETSAILKNPPFGFIYQNDFFNATMKIKTSLSPQRFLALLMWTEKHFKRKRSFKNAPRTLDLDIVFFDDSRIKSKHLTIPHPHWYERLSVLIPLAYME